ncbi:MAG: porin [Spongiibacteraceae bacterium]|nr:porin [Spongiibacteraceae bacterium]
MKKLKTVIVAGSVALLTSLSAFADKSTSLQERVDQLERELKALKADLDKPGVEMSKGTQFFYGGFIKMDAMWSDYSGGERSNNSLGDEILLPSTIPIGGPDGATRFDSHVKTSRFYFKTSTQSEMGLLKTHIELDLLTSTGNERVSNSSNTRLRHAYLAWDYAEDASVLVGQTWSTFFNVGALPETLDFIGPTSGTVFNRQTQLRWTKKLDGGSFMLAAENPSSGFYDGGVGFDGNNFDDNSMPDIVARYNLKSGPFAYSVALLGREISYDEGVNDDSYGVGLSVSGKYLFDNGDDLKFMFSHGALGRYIALNAFRDGTLLVDGSIDVMDVSGGFIAYRHLWSKKLRSTVSYAKAEADLSNVVAANTTSNVSNFNLNLIYSPFAKLSVGGEYIDAERQIQSGAKGDMKRLQFTVKYAF